MIKSNIGQYNNEIANDDAAIRRITRKHETTAQLASSAVKDATTAGKRQTNDDRHAATIGQ